MPQWRVFVLLILIGIFVAFSASAESARHLNLAECVELALQKNRALERASARVDGAEAKAPMAIAIMGGLISSTALTLLVVPAIYDLMDRFSRSKRTDEEIVGAVPATFTHAAGSET